MEPAPRASESWVWILVAVFVLLLVVPGMLMFGWGTGMMGGGTSVGEWWMLGPGLLVVGVVAVLAVLLLAPRSAEAGPQPTPPGGVAPPPAPRAPAQILDARYARGGIPREAYLRMRQDLESRRP